MTDIVERLRMTGCEGCLDVADEIERLRALKNEREYDNNSLRARVAELEALAEGRGLNTTLAYMSENEKLRARVAELEASNRTWRACKEIERLRTHVAKLEGAIEIMDKTYAVLRHD
jgi:peptidoglycan hydrolase CwlO-like protein